MPLADVHAVIARRLQQLGKGDLRRGHTHFGEGDRKPRIVDEGLAQRSRPDVAEPRDHRAESSRRRGELETEAGAVAAGHESGARRRAGAVGRVAVSELNTATRQSVDVRGGDRAAGDAASEPTQIVPAEVVRKDDHDVGRPLLLGPTRRISARIPLDGLRRCDIALHSHLDNLQQDLELVDPSDADSRQNRHRDTDRDP